MNYKVIGEKKIAGVGKGGIVALDLVQARQLIRGGHIALTKPKTKSKGKVKNVSTDLD